MQSRLAPLALVALLSLASVRSASAQDVEDFVAYLALTWTPQGALPPVVFGSRTEGPINLAMRYGRLAYEEDDAFNNFGVSVDFASGARARGTVTLGAVKPNCDGCDPILNASFEFESLLGSSGAGGSELTVGIKPSFGVGRTTGDGEATLITGALGLPISLRAAAQGTGMSVMPYVVPGMGFGLISGEGDSENGFRPMLGAGVRIDWARSGVGALVGLQKVFIEDGEMVFGAGLSIRAGSTTTP